MAGMVEFFTEVGENPELAGNFVGLVAGPTADRDEILNFFKTNDYTDVVMGDVDKLMAQRHNLKNDFGLAQGADY